MHVCVHHEETITQLPQFHLIFLTHLLPTPYAGWNVLKIITRPYLSVRVFIYKNEFPTLLMLFHDIFHISSNTSCII